MTRSALAVVALVSCVISISACAATHAGLTWNDPVRLSTGRGPSIVAHGGMFAVLCSRPNSDGKGSDLYFRSDLDDSDEYRVNDVPGEVMDGGENAPILLKSANDRTFYAIWNAEDTRRPLANLLRFSFWDTQAKHWSAPITINDDHAPSTHTFQNAAVSPDGTVHVTWLDRRELPAGKIGDYPGGGQLPNRIPLEDEVALYTARWKPGGSFETNVRISEEACPCCRPAIAFVGGKMLIAWRSVSREGIRDISVATSPDQGKTWGFPRVAVRDEWKINACPHVGPTLAVAGETLYLAWVTHGSRRSGLFLTSSSDRGGHFGTPLKLSEGISGATHPFLVSDEKNVIAVFQGSRDEAGTHAEHDSEAPHDHTSNSHDPRTAVYSYVVGRGVAGQPIRQLLKNSTGAMAFPLAAVNSDGRLAVGWTQSENSKFSGWVVLGRLNVVHNNQGQQEQ